MSKPDLLYIMNPKCGWCTKANPVVEEMAKDGHSITTLDITNPEDAKRANEVKEKHGIQCGTPLFIDAESGNAVCGLREDVLGDWVKGEKIPPPPPRPQQPQQPNMQQQQQQMQQMQQQQQQMSAMLDMHKFRLEIWQEAKQILSEKFYNDMGTWKDWKFASIEEDCPINEMPLSPTTEEIQEVANKIANFIQKRG